MDERDEVELSPEESISDEIGERVRSVIAAAESAAIAIRHEAEQEAQSKRRAAEAERHRYLEDARREADALLDERIKRISDLSDSIIEGAEAILLRIEGAQEVKRQLEGLVQSLGEAAEELAAESSTGPAPAAAAPRRRELKPVEPEPEAEAEIVEPEPVEAEADAEPEPEHEPEPPAREEPRRISPVERLREAAHALRGDNGAQEREEHGGEHSTFEGDEMLAARLVALQMAVAGSSRGEVEDHLRKTFDIQDSSGILNDVFGQESKL